MDPVYQTVAGEDALRGEADGGPHPWRHGGVMARVQWSVIRLHVSAGGSVIVTFAAAPSGVGPLRS